MSTNIPTADQITLAQTNINNMISWVNNAHSYLQDIINEVYSKVDQDASDDPGQAFATGLLDDLLFGMGGVDFIGSALVTSFLGNMFQGYVSQAPPSLQGAIGTVWDRFNQTFLQADTDLAVIYNNVSAHWNDAWTNPANGSTSTVSSFGDGSITMPTQDDPDFDTMTVDACANFKICLTKLLVPMRWRILQDPEGTFEAHMHAHDVIDWGHGFIREQPAYYITWKKTTGGDLDEWGRVILQNFIGGGSSDYYFAKDASNDMCEWLFQDDGLGTVTNPQGIALRTDVFCNWGLTGSMQPPDLSESD